MFTKRHHFSSHFQNLDQLPELDLLAEGGESGNLEPGQSVVFATLEVCLCVLVRHYPELSARAANLNSVMAIQAKTRLKGRILTEEQTQLISLALTSLAQLPSLCSPKGIFKSIYQQSVLCLLLARLIRIESTMLTNFSPPFLCIQSLFLLVKRFDRCHS